MLNVKQTIKNITTERGTLKPELISALNIYFMARALLETIKPVNDEIQTIALNHFKPTFRSRPNASTRQGGDRNGQLILDYRDLYLAHEEISAKIYDWHENQMFLKGFPSRNNVHPFIYAEIALIDAKNALFEKLTPYTKVTLAMVSRIDRREKYLELVLRALTSLPNLSKFA